MRDRGPFGIAVSRPRAPDKRQIESIWRRAAPGSSPRSRAPGAGSACRSSGSRSPSPATTRTLRRRRRGLPSRTCAAGGTGRRPVSAATITPAASTAGLRSMYFQRTAAASACRIADVRRYRCPSSNAARHAATSAEASSSLRSRRTRTLDHLGLLRELGLGRPQGLAGGPDATRCLAGV